MAYNYLTVGKKMEITICDSLWFNRFLIGIHIVNLSQFYSSFSQYNECKVIHFIMTIKILKFNEI